MSETSRSAMSSDGIDREELLEIIHEVEDEILMEDMTGVSRNQVAAGTCARIRNRIKSTSDRGEDL